MSLRLTACPLQAPAAKASRPSPGHFLLCGHAAIFGAATATAGLLKELVSDAPPAADGGDALSRWKQTFRATTTEAAAAVTPVGAYMLRAHMMCKEERLAEV